MVSVSAAQGKSSIGSEIIVQNTGPNSVNFAPVFVGKDAVAFSMVPSEAILEAGVSETFLIHLSPVRGAGSYEASLDVSEGRIPIRGIGLKGFEGGNEPPLDKISAALGIEIDVGGIELDLDTEEKTIGDSIFAGRFQGIEGVPVRITPLARFSPPGELTFGIVPGNGEQVPWGVLDASDETRPDNHQCLFPAINSGKHMLEKEAPKDPFALYIAGHSYVSFTDPELQTTAPIQHTARVYPVQTFQGRNVENAFLVAFEQSKNGDYQDTVLLVQNVIVE